MMSWWTNVRERVLAKSQRERLIISSLILALIYAVINFTLFMPLDKKKSALKIRLDSTGLELKKFRAEEKVLANALSNDPNKGKKREVKRLEARLDMIKNDLKLLSVGLVTAESLPQILHQVLRSTGSLKLMGMETLAPERLGLDENGAVVVTEEEEVDVEVDPIVELLTNKKVQVVETPVEAEVAAIYKHAVEIEVEGKYFDLLSYLEALELLGLNFFWEALDYEVTKYPKARVSIEIFTLSTEEGVLGV